MRLALVVAMTGDRVIGRDGALPWRISDDLRWFRKVTLGKPVIMGRRTFDSIGKALPDRFNIVVTRSQKWSAENVVVVSSLAKAVEAAGLAAVRVTDEICVIGGGEIFAQALPLADRIYLTRVHADLVGDAYFPQLDQAEWVETRAGACEQGARNDYACDFLILDRA